MGAYEYQSPSPFLGDLSCDGVFDTNDIAPFVLALIDPAAYQAAYPDCDIHLADLNIDGARDGRDVQTFVDQVLGK